MEKEVKLTYQYVMDLRDRLEKTSEIALQQLKQASETVYEFYKKNQLNSVILSEGNAGWQVLKYKIN